MVRVFALRWLLGTFYQILLFYFLFGSFCTLSNGFDLFRITYFSLRILSWIVVCCCDKITPWLCRPSPDISGCPWGPVEPSCLHYTLIGALCGNLYLYILFIIAFCVICDKNTLAGAESFWSSQEHPPKKCEDLLENQRKCKKKSESRIKSLKWK